MDKQIEQLIAGLDSIALAISANIPQGSQTYLETFGWNTPALSSKDVARRAIFISTQLKDANIEKLDPKYAPDFAEAIRRIPLIQAHQLPQMPNGNASQSIPHFFLFIQSIEDLISPLVGWIKVSDPSLYPQTLKRRMQSISTRLDSIGEAANNLDEKVDLINRAHEAAENLPLDLSELKETRKASADVLQNSLFAQNQIIEYKAAAAEALVQLQSIRNEADSIINRCEDTYRITTSVGLAASFEEKKKQLSNSMRLWTFGLAVSLISGAIIGHFRIEIVSEALKAGVSFSNFLYSVVVAILSLGAPLWFSWIATKQISQRFRLIEDYSYKASISKAYEGYRKEAIRIDPEFEKHLFKSALNRLDEAPLRLMENGSHGSPIHELANSDVLAKLASLLGSKQQSRNVAKELDPNE